MLFDIFDQVELHNFCPRFAQTYCSVQALSSHKKKWQEALKFSTSGAKFWHLNVRMEVKYRR